MFYQAKALDYNQWANEKWGLFKKKKGCRNLIQIKSVNM